MLDLKKCLDNFKEKEKVMTTTRSRIVRRVTTVKRHTLGYMLTGGKYVSRSQAINLAKSNKISGVRVINRRDGGYLVSTGSKNLYDLPITVRNS